MKNEASYMKKEYDIFGNELEQVVLAPITNTDIKKAKQATSWGTIPTITIIPNISIYPSRLVTYNTYEGTKPRNVNMSGLKYNNPEGKLSHKGSQRLRTAISWLNHLSKWYKTENKKLHKKFNFKINFITLTLPAPQIKSYTLPCGKVLILDTYEKVCQASNIGFGKFKYYLSDHDVKHKLLNHFITELRQKYKVKHYVWRAETQANGNIHIHFTLSKFIWHEDLRTIWNRILDKTDFINRYQARFINKTFEEYCIIADPRHNKSNKKLMKAWSYGNRTNWLNPNSTDVHSVRNIGNIEAYLSTYYCKVDETRRHVQGYLWRLSETLSNFKHAHYILCNEVESEWNYFCKIFKDKYKSFDYAWCLYTPIEWLFDKFHKSKIVEIFEAYKNKILNPEAALLPV